MAHRTVDRARRRVEELATLDDKAFADAYEATLLDPRNIDFSPYLVTAITEAKQWARLERELARRRKASA